MTASKEYRCNWQGIPLTVRHTPKRWTVIEHIEIESEQRQPLPISETGYKSHFLTEEDLAEYEGPVDFVRKWLDYVAETEGWHGEQFSLF